MPRRALLGSGRSWRFVRVSGVTVEFREGGDFVFFFCLGTPTSAVRVVLHWHLSPSHRRVGLSAPEPSPPPRPAAAPSRVWHVGALSEPGAERATAGAAGGALSRGCAARGLPRLAPVTRLARQSPPAPLSLSAGRAGAVGRSVPRGSGRGFKARTFAKGPWRVSSARLPLRW